MPAKSIGNNHSKGNNNRIGNDGVVVEFNFVRVSLILKAYSMELDKNLPSAVNTKKILLDYLEISGIEESKIKNEINTIDKNAFGLKLQRAGSNIEKILDVMALAERQGISKADMYDIAKPLAEKLRKSGKDEAAQNMMMLLIDDIHPRT